MANKSFYYVSYVQNWVSRCFNTKVFVQQSVTSITLIADLLSRNEQSIKLKYVVVISIGAFGNASCSEDNIC